MRTGYTHVKTHTGVGLELHRDTRKRHDSKAVPIYCVLAANSAELAVRDLIRNASGYLLPTDCLRVGFGDRLVTSAAAAHSEEGDTATRAWPTLPEFHGESSRARFGSVCASLKPPRRRPETAERKRTPRKVTHFQHGKSMNGYSGNLYCWVERWTQAGERAGAGPCGPMRTYADPRGQPVPSALRHQCPALDGPRPCRPFQSCSYFRKNRHPSSAPHFPIFSATLFADWRGPGLLLDQTLLKSNAWVEMRQRWGWDRSLWLFSLVTGRFVGCFSSNFGRWRAWSQRTAAGMQRQPQRGA